ncbi:hypothetical protein A6V39_01725 [Candidatus Mycoplasma haematobovis]|uniref:Uncharacterized protein n=1 Tax=Candidatus Mycoplasma haematobovis TaxID=432608 RepID=A0A1A9QDS9_9MOLU|nr:hypothetical protein [Candidatus Mycoplasma haematobovis]OAL10762.1 hypothetical protein A6V39_01725 [Candidatus Mycoplasma haematobovis]
MRDWDRVKLRDLAEKYMKNQEPSLKMAKSWENSEELVIDNKDLDGDFDSFKDACVNVLTTSSFEEDLELKTKQAIEWCTEPA